MSDPYGWPVKPFDKPAPGARLLQRPARSRTQATRSTSDRRVGSRRDGRLLGHPGQGVHRGQGQRRRGAGARGRRVRVLARRARGQAPPAGEAAPAARAHREGLGPRPLRGEPARTCTATRSGRARSRRSSTWAIRRSRRSCSASASGRCRRTRSTASSTSAASPTTRRRSSCRLRGRTCRSLPRCCDSGSCRTARRSSRGARAWICGPSASRTRSTSSTRTTRRRTTRTSPGCSCTSWPTTGTAPCTRTATTGSTSRPRTSIRTRRSRACRSRS